MVAKTHRAVGRIALLVALTTAAASVTQAATLLLSPVYFSQSSDRQSFLRLVNPGSAAGIVTIFIRDAQGATIGAIQKQVYPNEALQLGMDVIERAAGIAPTGLGALAVTPTFSGYAQHVVYNPVGGALTNVSVCGADVATDVTVLNNVHTSLITAYPSRVVVANKGTAGTASIDVFDAVTTAKLGTWTSSTIPGRGTAVVPISQIQSEIGFAPNAQYHLVMRLKPGFSGALTHLVDNLAAGVLTDMTQRCNLTP